MIRRLLAFGAISVACLASGCAYGIGGFTTDVTETGATLNGQVGATIDGPGEYWFRYGKTAGYGSATPRRTIQLTAGNRSSVTEVLTGLVAGTTYHFTVCADDEEPASPPTCGADNLFATSNPLCGDVITENLTLTEDMHCPGPGLIVGADDIKIDLGGHRLTGPGDFESAPAGAGIDNTGGYDGVTIANGEVVYPRQTRVDDALAIVGGSDNVLRSLRLSGGTRIDGDANQLVDVVADGLTVEGDDNVLLRTEAGATEGGSPLRVTGNRNKIDDSHIISFEGGVSVSGDANRITGTRFDGGPFGALAVAGSANLIEGNVIAAGGAALGVFDGSASVVRTNTVTGGIQLAGTAGAQLRRNTVRNADGDGIEVLADATGTILRRNDVRGARDDGIDVENADTLVRENTANDNADLGIEAVAGTRDLGGNTASGNGNPLQCLNIVCQ